MHFIIRLLCDDNEAEISGFGLKRIRRRKAAAYPLIDKEFLRSAELQRRKALDIGFHIKATYLSLSSFICLCAY
jgi:hypothetical protein